jgi:hypothetical protein
MRYFFHILDGSKFFPDGAGNNLPSVAYAKRLAEVVADELKKGGEFCRSVFCTYVGADDFEWGCRHDQVGASLLLASTFRTSD